MRGTAFQFFALGALCLAGGMAWGTYMGASGDHTMVGPHAHLNPVGGVLSMLVGFYYCLTPAAGESGLARIHLLAHIVALLIFIPGIVLTVTDVNHAVVGIGSIVTLAVQILFLVVIFRHGLGRGN